MVMRGTSFLLAEDMHKRLSIAAAAGGMSVSDYIRAAITAALTTHAQHDPIIATAFRLLDERAAEAIAAAEGNARKRQSIPA